ncbi:hypothetical protein ASPZODRAFT_11482 [Penicilliopsis zonata CBS 506.65]|uniref:SET domain-containing protein n=1 Tax=Penicilliopsis zonata CBS 506.65 TaxID=1073090 RepID=A0A1L9SU51_9EURO|nr:hypothetical protein ASPZODRAFT_11482 [Penicilliopsis zonata CBS 506.65]OJJ50617.1 hypothetical protein ASPZODRAFT_11482 [Penicilliopsis zonata CBS 506.65]
MDFPPDDKHLSFMQWALSVGVTIEGIAPARIPGRRLGMIATRMIEEGEVILTVPLAEMLTVDSIPASFVARFPDGTPVHAILAAFLMYGDAHILTKWTAWYTVWPSRDEFEECMPILWTDSSQSKSSLQSILPPSVSGRWNSLRKKRGWDTHPYETRYQNLLGQQEERLERCWKVIGSVFPEADWDAFSYYWLIVNTRSFYYVMPGMNPPEDWNDALALVPFADYFNHDDDADCEVLFDGKQYTFKAMRRFDEGEEIYMSYGAHSNDFLFVEYGFYLEHNESDAVYLDDIIFKDLTLSEKKELDAHDYYGNYQITSTGPCPRTAAAASIKYMKQKEWREYVLGSNEEGGHDPDRSATIIRGWVEVYLKECNTTIGIIEEMLAKEKSPPSTESNEDQHERMATVLRRWVQIKSLCEAALRSSGSSGESQDSE